MYKKKSEAGQSILPVSKKDSVNGGFWTENHDIAYLMRELHMSFTDIKNMLYVDFMLSKRLMLLKMDGEDGNGAVMKRDDFEKLQEASGIKKGKSISKEELNKLLNK